MPRYLILAIFGLCIAFVEGQNTEQDIKDFNNTIDNLLQENDLTAENSYRCGAFFAGDNLNDPPRFKVFIVPKRFPMECGKDEAAIKAEAKDECFSLFNLIIKKVTMESPSRKNAGNTLGDDLCKTLKDDADMKRPPGPGHPLFPEGVPVGFYYNVCTDSKWYDTELRVPDKVCCKGNRKGWKHKFC